MPANPRGKVSPFPPPLVYSLGPHWNALVFSDGTVVLQHKSSVVYARTGETVDLSSVEAGDVSVEDPSLFVVRTLALHADGSVHCDPHALSPGGVLTDEAYQVMDPTVVASRRIGSMYFESLVRDVVDGFGKFR